ncbi:hypothetical protein PUNSTDRAFT_48918, partial [Punctularia strigosozonata HHB-11173 SS5]|uniref:uncharacterized protein n=1 Tax=Punctularia strigosozonata (strain HHB-11173) TaxID=741275 RepID=UPI000441651D
MPLPRPGSAAGRSFETHRRAQHSIPPRLHPTPPQPAPMSAASQTLPSPVLRWLNGKRKSDSPSSSRPDSPSSPSSSHSALSEALNEDMLPARPVPA